MSKTHENNDGQLIMRGLQHAIEAAAKQCVEDAVKKFEQDLNQRISTIVLDVARQFSVTCLRDEVTITLKDARRQI